jgi:uncharacterized protein DUF3987
MLHVRQVVPMAGRARAPPRHIQLWTGGRMTVSCLACGAVNPSECGYPQEAEDPIKKPQGCHGPPPRPDGAGVRRDPDFGDRHGRSGSDRVHLLTLSTVLSLRRDVVPFPAGDSLPAFPHEALPARIRDVSLAVGSYLQVDPGIAAILALSVISTSIAGRFRVQLGDDWKEELVVWVMTPAESGERKSQVLKILLRPVIGQAERLRSEAHAEQVRYDTDRDLLERELAEWTRRYSKSVGAKDALESDHGTPDSDVARSKVAELAETLEKMREHAPQVPQLLANDVTPEALGAILASTAPALLASAEGGVIEGLAFARYSSGPPNLDLLNLSYDGDPYHPARISREARSVPRALAVVLVAPQPHVVTQLATNQFVLERGTLARFLYYFPASHAGRRVEDDEPRLERRAVEEYAALVTSLFQAPPELDGQPAPIIVSPDAARVLAEHRRRLDEQMAKLNEGERGLRSWLAKNSGRAMRLAAVLHFADLGAEQGRRTMVAARHAEAAVLLLDGLALHARHAFALIDEPAHIKNARLVLSWIQERGDGCIYPRRDVHRALRGMDAGKVKEALRELEERGFLQLISASTGGRPSDLVAIPFTDETATRDRRPQVIIGDQQVNDGFLRFRDRPGPECEICGAASSTSHGIVFPNCKHGPFVLTRGGAA